MSVSGKKPAMDVTFYPYGRKVSLHQTRIRLAVLEWTSVINLALALLALALALVKR